MGYPGCVPCLTDGVVTLRAYTLDDLDGLLAYCADPENVAWTTIPTPYGEDDGIDWITKAVPRGWADESELGFAIEAAHQDGVRRLAGGISLRPKDDAMADIGFAVHPAARGRGAARRAVRLLADWAFADRGADLLTWHAYVGNWASRRVAWANGFSFDGTIAQYLVQRGERRDAWVGTLRATDSREAKTTWNIPPVLETERLRLRPFTDADTVRLGEMINDERSVHFGGRVRGVRGLDGPAALHRIREQNAGGQMFNWCVADRFTDELVGKLQLFDLEGMDDTEVKPGYVIHPDARGRGYLTEALRALVEWTFRPVEAGGLGKRLITISTADRNAASRYAAEQAGFAHVATLPGGFPISERDFGDEVIYQRTNQDW